MSYLNSWYIRYSAPNIQNQTEVAVITAAGQITNEDPATPDHANRVRWANWATANSKPATQPFLWPVSMNPTIQDSFVQDPTGNSIKDSDIQFVVNSYVETVITEWIAANPAPATA